MKKIDLTKPYAVCIDRDGEREMDVAELVDHGCLQATLRVSKEPAKAGHYRGEWVVSWGSVAEMWRAAHAVVRELRKVCGEHKRHVIVYWPEGSKFGDLDVRVYEWLFSADEAAQWLRL